MEKTQENKLQNKKSFILYLDTADIFEALSDEQAGKLIKAILFYVHTGENPTLDQLLKIAFIPIKQALKRDLDKWRNKVKTNRENGLLGGRPKKASKSKAKQNNPSGFLDNPINPDSVNDNVSVNDNEKNIYDTIILSWKKLYPNEFQKNGKHQVSYVIAKRNELEKQKTREQIKSYLELYHNKILLEDNTLAPPDRPAGIVGLGGQLKDGWD